jgi:hypothetical protein
MKLVVKGGEEEFDRIFAVNVRGSSAAGRRRSA